MKKIVQIAGMEFLLEVRFDTEFIYNQSQDKRQCLHTVHITSVKSDQPAYDVFVKSDSQGLPKVITQAEIVLQNWVKALDHENINLRHQLVKMGFE